MIFSWFKRLRRRRILAEPFASRWVRYLSEYLPFYGLLNASEEAKLHGDLKVFIAEKNWEGCQGIEITDEIKVIIGAQACQLVLGLDVSRFDHVQTILVYPAEYFAEARRTLPDGTVSEDTEGRLGEAWLRGPVVLSWADTLHGCLHPLHGMNVVLHEFAHQLDMEDGVADGTPLLENKAMYTRWRDVMTREYDKLIVLSQRRRATLLDKYGAENPAEFFAVAAECFFERPLDFKRRHPRMYALLAEYFRQDPSARLQKRGRERS